MTNEVGMPTEDKGACPICGKTKRAGLQLHWMRCAQRRERLDVRAAKQAKKTARLAKRAAKAFDDTQDTKGTGTCPHCGKRKRRLQQHIEKRHYEVSRGLPPPKPKRKRLTPYERHAETPGIFRITPTFDVEVKGYTGARALIKAHLEEIARLLGATAFDVQDIHLLDSDDNYVEEPVDDGPGEDPMYVDEDAPGEED